MKKNLFLFCMLTTAGALMGALYLIFYYAPTEATMGIVQKIFYFHVPSAYAMYLGWTVCTVSSVIYLVRRREKWDMIAQSSAEIALLFAMLVMTTGPLWGRKSWGAYWTWDPRLTSALLLTLIIVSYVLLRSLGKGEIEKKFAAALSIVGACIMPIVHISVTKWRGQHPTVISSKGGGLAPDMKIAFAVSMVAFTLLFITLVIRRYALENNRRKLAALHETAVFEGRLEDVD